MHRHNVVQIKGQQHQTLNTLSKRHYTPRVEAPTSLLMLNLVFFYIQNTHTQLTVDMLIEHFAIQYKDVDERMDNQAKSKFRCS